MLRSERTRWDIHFAVGASNALAACELGPFDVVVSDMGMPDMDGASLLTEIKERFPSTARVILSGHADLALATRAVHVAHRFLTKPCEKSEVVATVERLCALQDVLCGDEMRKIVGTIGELPSFSRTYHSLRKLLQDPNVSVNAVADVIGQDVAMSAKVLQLVNSSFFGLAQNITNLRHATAHIGVQTISNLALATETFTLFRPDAGIPESVCESVQSHASRVATIAGRLSTDRKLHEISVISALLHDVGKLIMANRMPQVFRSVLRKVDDTHCRTFEAEEELLGVSHAELGAYLLGLWNLPSAAVEAVAFHHHPERLPHNGLDPSLVVYIANLVAHEIEEHPDDLLGENLSARDRECLQAAGLMDRFAEFRKLAVEEPALD